MNFNLRWWEDELRKNLIVDELNVWYEKLNMKSVNDSGSKVLEERVLFSGQ